MRSDIASAMNLHFDYDFPDVLSFEFLLGTYYFVKLSSPMGSMSGKARRDEGIGTGQGAA
jgi:hypothetical protein